MIRIKSNGDQLPTYFQKRQLKFLEKIKRSTQSEVEVKDTRYQTIFVCDTLGEAYRPLTLWIKEPGTMKWIDSEVRAGDVFLDIGANIGIYTLAAAHRVGDQGKVYAVEPHKPNALALMRNVLRNKLSDRVDVLSLALSDKREIARFNYVSLSPSSTGSQLGTDKVAGSDDTFVPVLTEMVVALSVDELVESGSMKAPNLIKVDVDGNEPGILRGMSRLLNSAGAPRAVQVELNVGGQDEIVDIMSSCGFKLSDRHFTMAGQKQHARGVGAKQIAHNAIFRK